MGSNFLVKEYGFNIEDSYFLSDDDSLSFGVFLFQFSLTKILVYLDDQLQRDNKSLDQLTKYLNYLHVKDEDYLILNELSGESCHNIIKTSVFKHRRRALLLTETQKGHYSL